MPGRRATVGTGCPRMDPPQPGAAGRRGMRRARVRMSFTIPNLLSLLRMALVGPFIIALLNGQVKRALLVVVVAGVSDVLGGLIARFFHQQSLLGPYLDPLADKLLVTAAYVILALPGLRHAGAFQP